MLTSQHDCSFLSEMNSIYCQLWVLRINQFSGSGEENDIEIGEIPAKKENGTNVGENNLNETKVLSNNDVKTEEELKIRM